MPKNENQLNKAVAIFKLLLSETDDEHVLKTYDIEELLYEAYGIEVEQRAILRDINNLVDLLNTEVGNVEHADEITFEGKYYLEYDFRNDKKGYHITERPFSLPEIAFLIECINSSKGISDKTASELKEKVASLRSVYEKEELLNKSDAYTLGRNRVDNEKLLTALEEISYAIKNNHKISFVYKNYTFVGDKPQKTNRRMGEKYKISPFKTLIFDSNYYVLAFSEKNNAIIPYRLDRMEDIKEIEDEKRQGHELFNQINLDNYTKEIFNMFSGKREFVTIRFTNDLLATIIDRFGTKGIKRLDNNHFTLETHVMVSDQFFSWLCGFKKKAKIVSPPSLVDEFKSFLDDIYKTNDNFK